MRCGLIVLSLLFLASCESPPEPSPKPEASREPQEPLDLGFSLHPVNSPVRLLSRSEDGMLLVALKPRLYADELGCTMVETGAGATSQVHYCLSFRIEDRSYLIIWDTRYGSENRPRLDPRKEYTFLVRPRGSGAAKDDVRIALRAEVIRVTDGDNVLLDNSKPPAPTQPQQ